MPGAPGVGVGMLPGSGDLGSPGPGLGKGVPGVSGRSLGVGPGAVPGAGGSIAPRTKLYSPGTTVCEPAHALTAADMRGSGASVAARFLRDHRRGARAKARRGACAAPARSRQRGAAAALSLQRAWRASDSRALRDQRCGAGGAS
jgi:hypothetical protein